MAETTATPRPAGQSGATGAADQAKEQAQQVAGQAKEQAQQVAGQAKEQAQQLKGQASSQVRTQVDQRSTQAGEQVVSTASDIRSIGDQLREQGKDKPAQLADQAAQRVEAVGTYLRDKDADSLLQDVEDFARQRPWAVIAGGIALGFAASRFLKASSSQRFDQRYGGGFDQQRYTPTPAQLPTGGYDRPAVTTPPPAGVPLDNELSSGVGGTSGRRLPTEGSPLSDQRTPTTGGAL
jgi:ElaB/YqjD/DUF883 family membrane-anchored ribosome-binding protein